MYKALIILGPTAIGKSSIAEQYSSKYKTPLISADSRQLFKELNIGVAKPNEQSIKNNDYYEIGSLGIQDESNVALYCQRVAKQFANPVHDIIVVGGTGFYIKALIEGYEKLPQKNPELRQQLQNDFKNGGIKSLLKRYENIKNPYTVKDFENPYRLMRAIEMGEQRIKIIIPSPLEKYEIHVLGLTCEREDLYQKINMRVDTMMAQGLLLEVEKLQEFQNLPSLQSVGYKELFNYLNGEWDLDFAIDKIKQHTRNYAKRQLTYFKNQLNVHWCDIDSTNKIDTFVSNILS